MAQKPTKPSSPSKPKVKRTVKKKGVTKVPAQKSSADQFTVPSSVPVIGLGASAGGLKAFTDFFEAMPGNNGMAFVVIHHVDPDHESLMADLLASHTKMTVKLAEDQAEVAPDHVYVIPPNRFLSIREGRLHLTEPAEPRGLRLPIDFFLRSLAEEQKHNAVGIILSGTGSDGTTGIRSIKENGGMVLVQDPKEATQAGMPRSAIATGSVDHVLPVAKMPAVISAYVAHPFIARTKTSKVLGENARGSLAGVIDVLKAHSPINYASYKEGTLLRRIERRMALRHMENSDDYLALLKDSPEEAEKLCADLLISVTSFFRDPEAFDYLAKNAVRDLVQGCETGRPIRIWVPACATGEEAYSLAMLFIEKISSLRKDVKLQIFASDVDEYALSVARSGVYPDSIAADVSADRLSRFFVKEDHTYRVTPELRDSVVFAHQNILVDAPFSKLDMVSCRNLLIYLNAEAQDRILQTFHFALNDDGLLFLGSSETANSHEMLFEPISRKYRLYRRLGGARHRHFDFPISKRTQVGLGVSDPRTVNAEVGQRLADVSHRLLVDEYAPAAVVINSRMETLFVQGPADQYLRVPAGAASQDLLAMAREGLRAKLGSVVRNAMRSRALTKASGTVVRSGQSVPVTITAHPIEMEKANLLLITFVDEPEAAVNGAPDLVPGDATVQHQLEQELEATRQELQSTIRDYERSTEELKASNEETMSMNEEFQSTNEELETSKEELQSLNEELTTLNTQLEQKVEDERRLSDDLNNLLSSSGIATLFLDRQLNIMRFTPATRDLFNVIANDVGRPFGDITSRIDDQNLMTDAQTVLRDLTPVAQEVRTKNDKWFIRRIMPYRTQDGKIEGLVITFSDVTELKKLQQATKAAQLFAESIIDTVRGPLLVLDGAFNVVTASRSFLRMFNVKLADLLQKSLYEVLDGEWDIPALRRLLERILPDKTTVEDYSITLKIAAKGERTLLVNARRIEDGAKGGEMILLTADDVTERRTNERELEEREARLRAILDAAPEAIITIDEHGTISSFSPAAETILGYTAQEAIGQNVSILMPEPHRAHHDGYLSHYITTGEKKIIGIGREMAARRKDGSEVPIRLTVAEFWIDGARHFTGILDDMTDDMKRRSALQRAQKMEAVGQLTGGLAHDFNNLLTVIIGNLELLEMQLGDSSKLELLTEALEASNLGAKLTTQLLTFSRRQALDPENVLLNDVVKAIKPLLVRTLGEQISVNTQLADDLCLTLTDPGQIENAMLNLAINARDAMPDGGSLTIETKNVTLDKDYTATQVDVAPGRYVALSVTDTGVGMTPEVADRAFDPFFTTKPVGAGSGLGLSMVYGFAKQSGGHVAIYSEVGLGTTVMLFLPVVGDADQERRLQSNEAIAESGGETILVVEDDPRVRRLTVTRLEGLGYKIMAAETGPEAIEILRNSDGIDLVLSDVVMPGGMTGFDVAEQAVKIRPGVKILLMTGYASGGESLSGSGRRHPILRKPNSLRDLAKALRDLLG